MAIADTINSIRTHLETDYEALENIGAELENVDKNIENIASCLEEVYDNLPKTTGEDTSLSLNTIKGKMNTTLKGDTQQTTYNGYNILENKMANSVSRSGITYTKREDGSVLVNGTATGLSYCVLTNTAGNINGYTTALFTMESSFYCTPQNDINSVTMQYRLTNGDYKNYSNLASNDVIGLAYLQVNSGVTINNLVVYPMIVNGSSAVKPYEPYVGGTASPNPTYPQNIEVVTGTQEVKVENKNLIPTPYVYDSRTINGITFTINNDYSISVSGTATGNATFVLLNETSPKFEYIRKLLLNNSCTLSGCPSGGSSSSYRLQLYGRGSAGTGTSVDYGSGVAITNFENATNNFNIAIFIPSGTTISTPIIFKPQLEKGSVATTYTPHQEQTQIVELSSKNLFNGNWTNGIRLNATTGAEESNANSSVSGYIPVDFIKNTNYYLSGLLNTMHSTIWAYNSNKQGLHRTANETRTSLGLTSNSFVGGTAQGTGDIAYIRINMRIETGDTGSLNDLTNANVQLEKRK